MSIEEDPDIDYKTLGDNQFHIVQPTGLTVGEPNQSWHIDNYRSNRIGRVNFPEKGFYTIEMTVEPYQNEEVKFQWLWIN